MKLFKKSKKRCVLVTAGTIIFSASLYAAEPQFESTLFKSGKLVYNDTFDGQLDKERWGMPKGKQVKTGTLTVSQLFQSTEEAMNALKRDHHLGLEPVVSLKGIPEKFVCHVRYKFEMPKLAPSRPCLQIGHHMILFHLLEEGGHRIKLPDGPTFYEAESKAKLGEWINLIIEYKKGTIRLKVNDHEKTYQSDKVTIINPKDKHGHRFTFKGGPDCKIIFDSVSLWDCTDKE